MSTKKLILIFILIFVALFFMISTFISVRYDTKEKKLSKSEIVENRNRVKNIKRFDNEQVKTKYSSSFYSDKFLNLTYAERDVIDERITYIVDLINNRKLQEFYDNMNNNYKRARFPSFSVFSEYFNEIFPAGNKYDSTGFEIDEDYLKIFVQNTSTNSMTTSIVTSSMLDTASDNLHMTFDMYISTEPISFLFRDDRVLISSESIIDYVGVTALELLIYNNTDEEIKLDFSNSKLIKAVGQNEYGYDLYENNIITVQPKSYKNCEIKFNHVNRVPRALQMNLKINDELISSRVGIYQIQEYIPQ